MMSLHCCSKGELVGLTVQYGRLFFGRNVDQLYGYRVQGRDVDDGPIGVHVTEISCT